MAQKDTKLTDEEILVALKEQLALEKSYDKVLSSMCTPPLNISRLIASEFAEINLGDPGLFPKTKQMEIEVLEKIAEILHAPQQWSGSITSGGSESNLLGCWTARNWSRKNKGIKNGGTLLLPESAHASFEKSIDLLNLNSKWLPLNEKFQMDIEALKEALDETTIGIIGIAGTTGTGVCDDIKALSEITQDNDTYLHVDAAHGGLIFPFMDQVGRTAPSFDFNLEGVKSITLDTHKIMGSLIPGGSIVYRSEKYSETIAKGISYLADSSTKQITVTGTRPGNSVISSWTLFKYLGTDFLIKRVKRCLELTDYLVEKISEIPSINLSFDPTINIVGFTTSRMTNEILVTKLKKYRWDLSIFGSWARIVIMPHFTVEMIDKLMKDLKTILKE